MRWHPDPECDRAVVRLIDALCSWERSTGRQSLLVLIPVEEEEKVVVADSGKPIDIRLLTNETIAERVKDSLDAHDRSEVHTF